MHRICRGRIITRHLQPKGIVTHHFDFFAWQYPQRFIPSACWTHEALFAFSSAFIPKASLTWGFQITEIIGSIGDEDPAPRPVLPPVICF